MESSGTSVQRTEEDDLQRPGQVVIVATQMLVMTSPRHARRVFRCGQCRNTTEPTPPRSVASGWRQLPKEAVAIMARTCVEAENELAWHVARETELAVARKRASFPWSRLARAVQAS